MNYTVSAPSRVEALLFDLGGVVIDIDFNRAFQFWSDFSALSFEQIQSRFKMDAAYERHERGEIDGSEYFDHLRNVLGLEASNSDIALGWNAIFVGERVETVNDILSVKDHTPCFAFTNSNTVHCATWVAAFPRVVKLFERVFVSSEMGVRKPERAAFSAISDATGIKLASMIFFDDMLENVLGAREAGLQAVHVKTPRDVRRALVETGILQ